MDNEESNTTVDAELTDEHIQEAYELYGARGLWTGQIVYTGVKLGMFEVLDGDPTPARAVAEELELEPEYSYRLLRALAHCGAMEEDDDRRFLLTTVGAFFRKDHPYSVRDDVLFSRSPEYLSSMFHLPDIVKEGGPSGFAREFGCSIFEYAERNPEFAAAFNGAISNLSQRTTPKVLDALDEYDFDRLSHVCDVGGGQGHTLCHLLAAHPHLEGTVLDLPHVVEAEDDHWAPKLGVAERCNYVAGDMFESVPRAGAYVLKFVLHDWSDDDCVEVLSTIHEAAPPDARVLVVEQLVPGPETPHRVKRADVETMMLYDVHERTESEYRSLLERADWEFARTLTSEEDWETLSVVEARKA